MVGARLDTEWFITQLWSFSILILFSVPHNYHNYYTNNDTSISLTPAWPGTRSTSRCWSPAASTARCATGAWARAPSRTPRSHRYVTLSTLYIHTYISYHKVVLNDRSAHCTAQDLVQGYTLHYCDHLSLFTSS